MAHLHRRHAGVPHALADLRHLADPVRSVVARADISDLAAAPNGKKAKKQKNKMTKTTRCVIKVTAREHLQRTTVVVTMKDAKKRRKKRATLFLCRRHTSVKNRLACPLQEVAAPHWVQDVTTIRDTRHWRLCFYLDTPRTTK